MHISGIVYLLYDINFVVKLKNNSQSFFTFSGNRKPVCTTLAQVVMGTKIGYDCIIIEPSHEKACPWFATR